MQELIVHLVPSGELNQRHTLYSVIDQHVISARLALFSSRCPSAVARFIAAIWVNTVKRMAVRWTTPKVRQKGAEVVAPFIAHSDSSSAPIVESNRIRVVATRLCVIPRFIFWRYVPEFAPSNGFAVNQRMPAPDFTMVASTTARSSLSECISKDMTLSTTVATTPPDFMSARTCRQVQYKQTVKAPAG